MKSFGLFQIWLLLALAFFSTPDLVAFSTSQIQFRTLGIEDGLSQSTVQDMVQDHLGFIWLATSDGLNMYDGYRFTIHKEISGDPESLSKSDIFALGVGPDNSVWAGATGPSLNRLLPNRKGWQRIELPPLTQEFSATDSRIQEIAFLGDYLLAGTFGAGMLVYNIKTGEGTWHHASSSNDTLSHNTISSILTWDERYAWVATLDGLHRFDVTDGSFRVFTFGDVVPADAWVTSLARVGQGDILAWLNGQGMVRIRIRDEEAYRLPIPIEYQSDIVSGILPLEDGSIWLGFRSNGIGIYDPASTKLEIIRGSRKKPHWLKDDTVQGLFQDRNGLIWIGTYSAGAQTFHPELAYFKTYRANHELPNSLSGDLVLSFTESLQGYIWIGTQNNGLNRFDPIQETFETFKHDPNDRNTISNNSVVTLLADPENNLWIGTGFGLNRMSPDRKQITRYTSNSRDPTSLGHNAVTDLALGTNGDLWIATFGGGLQKMDTEQGTFERFPMSMDTQVSPGSNWLNDIVLDENGTLWIATQDHGLTLFDTKTSQVQRRYDEQSHLSTDSIACVLLDGEYAWLGTYGGGLMRMQIDSGEVTTFRIEDGLPNDTIYGILQSNQGHLWMSTNKGISRLDPETLTFWNFNVEDGLQSNEFNYNAFFKSNAGELYFGGISGFNRFNPADVVPSTNKPEVVLTSFRVFNQEVKLDRAPALIDDLQLTHLDRVLSFSFSATDYVKPHENQFAYRLEGFNDDWIDNGNQNTITYTNLDSGDYLLQIKAANSQGVWGENYLEIPITMKPPYWRSMWAYLLYFLLIVSIITLLIRSQRQRASQELNQAINLGKAEFATTVLHNIGNVLNSLHVSCDQMIRIVEESRIPQMQRAHRMLVKNLDNLNDFLKNDPKGQILPRYFETANDVLSEERIEIRAELDDMNRKIRIMKEIIETQQSSAKINLDRGSLNLNAIVEEALTVQSDSLTKFDVLVRKNLDDIPPIQGNKTQMVHIMINLIKNATEAVTENRGDRVITITTKTDPDDQRQVVLIVKDTGVGIAKENLDSMFRYGFTTKKTGHGFGLNYCAKAIKDMGGTIAVESDGVGHGARFVIKLNKSTSIPN